MSPATDVLCKIVQGRGLAKSRRASDVNCINKAYNLELLNGSLNLVSKNPVILDADAAFHRSRYNYYWWGELNGHLVVINRFEGCPLHIYEVFGEVHFRSAYKINSDTVFSLKILPEAIHSKETLNKSPKSAIIRSSSTA